MTFSDVAKIGLFHIYEKDLESQKHFLTVFCENVRKASLATLLELKCFFVPNNDYILAYFGEDALNPEYDLYVGNNCVWTNVLVVPIFNVAGECVAFIGYDFLQKIKDKENNKFNGPYYSTSSRSVFINRNYLFYPGNSFDLAFNNYIVIADGVFDAISIYSSGYNSCSMLGSAVTAGRMMQLQFIPNLYVAADNDKAGKKLYQSILKYRPDAHLLAHNLGKDADEALSSNGREDYLNILRTCVTKSQSYFFNKNPNFKLY